MNISSQTLDAISFVAITPSFECHFFDVLNTSGQVLLIRTDPADSNTEINVQDLQKISANLFPFPFKTGPRFVPSAPVYYGKLAAGSGSIKKLHD